MLSLAWDGTRHEVSYFIHNDSLLQNATDIITKYMSQSSTLSISIRTSAGNDKSQTGLGLAQKRFSSQDHIQPVVVYIGMAKIWKFENRQLHDTTQIIWNTFKSYS